MRREQQTWRRRVLSRGVVPALAGGLLMWAVAGLPAASASVTGAVLDATFSAAPGLGGSVHRFLTHVANSMGRAGALLGQVGVLWLWIVLSLGAFFLVAAFSSVADLRMWDLRREGPRAVWRYLGHGMRTFFRILRDRHTPYAARCVLAVALLYWLAPLDLIEDSSLLPGFLDDLLVAVLAAKAFIYFCPDALVAAHAADVEAQA